MARQLSHLFNRILDKQDELLDIWDEKTNLSKTVIGLFLAIVLIVAMGFAVSMLPPSGPDASGPAAPVPISGQPGANVPVVEEPEEAHIAAPEYEEPVIDVSDEPKEPEPVIDEPVMEVAEPEPVMIQIPAPEKPFAEHIVTIEGNLVFKPDVIQIFVGDVVVWKNNDYWGLKTFPIYSDEGLWDVMNVPYNESVRYAFTYPGHFKYHSYAGMKGEVMVAGN